MKLKHTSEGIYDEDNSHQSSKTVLRKAGYVLNKEAQVEHDNQKKEERCPHADPQAKRHKVYVVAVAVRLDNRLENYHGSSS